MRKEHLKISSLKTSEKPEIEPQARAVVANSLTWALPAFAPASTAGRARQCSPLSPLFPATPLLWYRPRRLRYFDRVDTAHPLHCSPRIVPAKTRSGEVEAMLWQVASRPHPQRWPPSDPTEPSVALDVPEPSLRTGHTFVALPDGRMLLFGGYDGYKPLSDLFIYSPDTGKWAPVLRGPENAARIVCAQAFDKVWPPPRSYHTATMIFDSETEWKMFVVGGKGKVDLESDVYELKISTRKTSMVGTGVSDTDVVKLKSYEMSKDGKQAKTYTAAVPRMQWKRLDFADEDGEVFHLPSDRPAARCMHSATPIDGQKVLILGGQGRVGRRLADLWEFNTMTYKWRQLHIRGWGPASGHTCVEIEPGRLLVLGGESDDGKPMGMNLYHIDYATAADVPVVEVHKGTLACGPIILADNFDAGGAGAENSAWQQRDSVFGGLRGVANQTPESRSLHSFNELLLGLSDSLSGTRTGSIDRSNNRCIYLVA